MWVLELKNPDVPEDIQFAIDWYNFQQKGLGKKFFTQLSKELSTIQKNPLAFAVRHHEVVRCKLVKKFPYLIHYMVDKKHNRIVISRSLKRHF